MSLEPYLLLTVAELTYAVDATAVQEIFRVPEITPIAEAHPDVAGAVSFRGRVVPIVHLGRRLHRRNAPVRLSDLVVVVEYAGSAGGLLVEGVREVTHLETAAIEPVPVLLHTSSVDERLAAGVIRVADRLIVILNLESLLQPGIKSTTALQLLDGDSGGLELAVDPAAREVLRERALQLAPPVQLADASGLRPMAVFRLGDECFGVGLQRVREFVELRGITPIPCAPPQIYGVLNLRGEILTLLDIRSSLQLPAAAFLRAGKVIVVDTANVRAGIVVDDVLEIVYLAPSDITPPAAGTRRVGADWIHGTAPCGDGVFTALDLPTLLAGAAWIVDEQV